MIALFLVSATLASGVHNYLHLPLHESVTQQPTTQSLSKFLENTIENNRKYYGITFQIGTPGQEVSLLLDTGSSDVWVMDSHNPYCPTVQDKDERLQCRNSSFFDSSKSSTYSANNTYFSIHYGDDTFANGTFAQDTATFGNGTVKGFNFAYAKFSNSTEGVAGIGLASGETQYKGHVVRSTYMNLPQQLKSSGLTSHVSYSLWLNAQSTKSGSVLFGGIDRAKYTGDLYRLPMVESDGDGVDRTTVELRGMSAINGDGVEQRFAAMSDYIVLDSGSTVSMIPPKYFNPFAEAIGADGETGVWLIECETLEKSNVMLGLQIGGIDIHVPVNELGSFVTNNKHGKAMCYPGFIPGDTCIMGDNILRKLYVVYDLENLEIGLATAKAGEDLGEDIVAISSGIPGKPAPEYSATRLRGGYYVQSLTVIGSRTAHASPSSSSSARYPEYDPLTLSTFAVTIGGSVSGADNRIRTDDSSIGTSKQAASLSGTHSRCSTATTRSKCGAHLQRPSMFLTFSTSILGGLMAFI